jgi:hypothetical protein
MERSGNFERRYFEYLYAPRYEKYHAYLCPEPWSRRRVVVTWVVIGLFVIAGAAAALAVRNENERSWCSGGGVVPASQECLAEQKAIRCFFGLLHCPPGGD